MNKLPYELENEIWSLYWMDIFKTNCINYLKQEEDKLLKLDFFIKKHVFPTESNLYLKQIKYYLIEFNKYLENLKNNKSLILYFNNKIPNFNLIYSSDNSQEIYKNVNDNFKYIASYALINSVPYMQYYTLEKFKMLSKN